MRRVDRFTIRYVPVEDRMHLAVAPAGGDDEVFAITRKLLNRLAAECLGWLRKTSTGSERDEAVQAFNQQAAVSRASRQAPSTPGEIRGATAQATLVTEINIRGNGSILAVTLKAGGRPLVTLPFTEADLRRWLSALHQHYAKAGWSEPFWPSWIAVGPASPPGDRVALN